MANTAERVRETSTTSGTGAFTLLGAVTGYRTFASAFTTGTVVFYAIDDGAGNWEVGSGTYTTSGATLSRTTVIASSNANNLVNFGAGTKQVYCTAPSRALLPDQTGNSGKFLKTDATNPSWATPTASDVGALALAGGTMSGGIAMGNNNVSGLKTGTFNAEYDMGNSGTAITMTFTNGQNQKVTLTGNTTITLSTASAGVGHYQLKLIQDATGSRTVAWSGTSYSASRWLGASSATAPLTAANSVSIVNFYFDGTNLYQSMSHVGAA